MLAPSRSRLPRFFVAAARSDPARSMSDNFPTRMQALMPAVRSISSTVIYQDISTTHIQSQEKEGQEWTRACMTACDRELSALASVGD
jgi:hypothetical protein